MSPELIDAEIQGHRRTKYSDRYALGMVIYEVLGGYVPFYKHTKWAVPGKVVKGDRPERPQGAGEAWFTDPVWDMLKCCWVAEPKDRPSIEDILRCLEEASRAWTPPSLPQVAVLLTTDSSATGIFELNDEESVDVDEGEVPPPSRSLDDHELLQEDGADNDDVYSSAHEHLDPYHDGPRHPVSTQTSVPIDISRMSSYNNPPLDGSPFTSAVVPSGDRLSPIPDKVERVNNRTTLLPVLPGPFDRFHATKGAVAATPSALATVRTVGKECTDFSQFRQYASAF